MQTHGTKKEVAEMVRQHVESMPGMPSHRLLRAVVFVGQVSARRYMVGTAYDLNPIVGESLILPHLQDFIGWPIVVAVR